MPMVEILEPQYRINYYGLSSPVRRLWNVCAQYSLFKKAEIILFYLYDFFFKI